MHGATEPQQATSQQHLELFFFGIHDFNWLHLHSNDAIEEIWGYLMCNWLPQNSIRHMTDLHNRALDEE